MKALTYICISVLFLLSFCNNAFSQTDTSGSFLMTDTISTTPVTSGHSVYSSIGYGSIKIYPGTSIPQNQNYGFASLMYGFKNRLFVAASAFDLINSDYVADIYSLSINYSHSFSKWFDLSLTGAGFQFNKGFTDTLIKNFTYGDISTGIDWKILYTSLSASGYFSDKTQFYFQLKNSRYFQTPSILKGKAFFSFNPYINLLFGTDFQTGTALITSQFTTYDTLNIPDGNNQPAADENGNRTISGSSNSNSATLITSTSTYSSSEITSITKRFGLLEINLGLPVSLNFKNLTIEADVGYVIPFSSEALLPRPEGFAFMISGFLKIF